MQRTQSTSFQEKWAPPDSSTHRERRKGLALWGQQYAALMYKNYLMTLRNWQQTLIRCAAPLFFMLIIYGINQAYKQQASVATGTTVTTPDRAAAGGIPDCAGEIYEASPCFDFVYTPSPSVAGDAIAAGMMANNPSRVIPASRVLGFATNTLAEAFMSANPRQVQLAVHFLISTDGKTIGYGMQVNGTAKSKRGLYGDLTFRDVAPLQVNTEREIFRYLQNAAGFGSTVSWDVGYKAMAHPAVNPFSAVGSFAATALMIAGMFALTFEVFNIVTERKNKLRQAMASMGLMQSAYWMSWFSYELLINTVTSLLTVLFGMLFQFDLFLRNDFGVVYLLFWTYEFALIGLMLLFSTVINDASASYLLGLVYVIIGFIMQVSVVAGFPYDSSIAGYQAVAYIFSFFPPPMLAKGVSDLGLATAAVELKGIRWNQIVSYCSDKTYFANCVWPLRDVYCWLMGDCFLYFLIAVYLDNVLPDEMGVRKPLLYFLQPGFWIGSGAGGCCTAGGSHYRGEEWRATDSDVMQEEETLRSAHATRGASASEEVVEVQGLVKTFPPRAACCGAARPFHAVKGNWFTMEAGKLFCLLGPNGAGKTTTINMLTGVLPVTAGDASVCGISLTAADGMDRVRAIMGVCPQFDLLWGELTGVEHLRVFGLIKGLLPSTIEPEARSLLERTKLTRSAGVESRAYSGGMKRRLSVAVAMIGDPKVLYLDEPTTGMDPISRRHVWDIINAAKPGRIIVLTTHSMEEADVLADQVSIICRGRLQCLGTGLHLKQRFGAGYNISVAVSESAPAAHGAAGASAAGRRAGGGGGGGQTPAESRAREAVRALFQGELGVSPFEEDYLYMQGPESGSLLITDVVLSLTTLEEVFLKIATQAELEYAREEGRTETILLDNGTSLRVLVGAGLVFLPGSTDSVVEIKWDQDEEGRLLASEWKIRPYAHGDMPTDAPAAARPGGGPPLVDPPLTLGPGSRATGVHVMAAGAMRSVPVAAHNSRMLDVPAADLQRG